MINTLLDPLLPLRRRESHEVLRHDLGFRTEVWDGGRLWKMIGGFAAHLEKLEIHKGDRIIILGENHPAWVIAFWGAVIHGVQVVPIDPAFTPQFVEKVQGTVKAKLLVLGRFPHPPPSFPQTITYHAATHLQPENPTPSQIEPDDPVEIVFTSGTTASPKGVVLTHRNICSVLRPFEAEFNRYRVWLSLVQPFRILNLLPLNHMFGQMMGLFIPLLMGSSCVLSSNLSPARIQSLIRRNRASVLVSVPRVLRQLRRSVEQKYAISPWAARPGGVLGIGRKWWRYRHVHRDFGWKFWAVVTGGASLHEQDEAFWNQLGFLLIQGYGLTEASPIISVNHPFRSRRGTLGQILPGQQVRLSQEGEILVRGNNVAETYWTEEGPTRASLADQWLRTGDLAAMGEDGRLRFKGRKSSLIVTSEGLNVHAEEVEHVLDQQVGVIESALIGTETDGITRLHAVLVLDPACSPNDVVRKANLQLEAHQQIRDWSLWPQPCLPRTPSTLKLKRNEIRDSILRPGRSEDLPAVQEHFSDPVSRALLNLKGSQSKTDEPTSEAAEILDLSSLDRVDLLSRLEDDLAMELDESEFAAISTRTELLAWIEENRRQGSREAGKGPAPRAGTVRAGPDWPRRLPFTLIRDFILEAVTVPLFRHYFPLTLNGLRHLENLPTTLIIAANHSSHLDTIALLASLPHSLRNRVCPAVRSEYFQVPRTAKGLTRLRCGLRKTAELWFAFLLFNIYLLPQEKGGLRNFLEHSGRLVAKNHSPLIFPEGRRTEDGQMLPFQEGIGMLALSLSLPVLPVHLEGLYEAMPRNATWPKPGPVRVAFGPPLFDPEWRDARQATSDIQEAVHRLAEPKT